MFENFEEVPTFPGSKLNSIVENLEPIIYNDTIKSFNEDISYLLKLLNSTNSVLERKIIQTVIDEVIYVETIFTDDEKAIEILTSNEYFDQSSVNALLKARLKMGMLTGDIISVLNLNRLNPSLLFPYATDSVLSNLKMIFEEELYNTTRKMMLSNINWKMLVSEYQKFKENGNIDEVSSFITNSMESLRIRKKRQVESASQSALNITDIETVISVIQNMNMNMTLYMDVASRLADELIVITNEVKNMEELMSSGQINDVSSMVTAFITSPQMAKITASIVLMMDEMQPFMKDTEYMEVFEELRKNLQNLNSYFRTFTTNLKLSDVLQNWSSIKSHIKENQILTKNDVEDIGSSLVSAQIVFTLFNKLDQFPCSEETVTRYIDFSGQEAVLNTTIDGLAISTCRFIQSEKMIELLSVIDMDSAAKYVTSVGLLAPENLAKETNMTVKELEGLLQNLGQLIEIFPRVEDLMTSLYESLNVTTFNYTTISTLFCGVEILSFDNEKYEVSCKFLLQHNR